MTKVKGFSRSLKGFFYLVFTWTILSLQVVYGISNSKLATGTQALINDVTLWLVILAPIAATLFVVYFLIRRSNADEMDQKTWNKRISTAIISGVLAVLASGLINVIIGYYS